MFLFRAVRWVSVMACLGLSAPSLGQEATNVGDDAAAAPVRDAAGSGAVTDEPSSDVGAAVEDAVDDTKEEVGDVAEQVDRSAQAQRVSAGILRPIYSLAERFSFPAFHWAAFAVMVAGVVSFGLQLVLGKLMVLARMSFSFTEILSDALGLAVSLVGLVLTTQAAAENSNFTASAFSVISASAVGAFVGFLFYIWGQRLELQAVEGRRAAALRGRTPKV